MEIKSAFETIQKIIAPVLEDNKFAAVRPKGAKAGELPLETDGDVSRMVFSGEKGAVKVEYSARAGGMALYFAESAQPEEGGYAQASLWMFDGEKSDERDARSIANDFDDTITERFGSSKKPARAVKMPVTVSKSQAKSGALAYDPKTLATRFAALYPEFKDPVKENVTKYGDFMPEEFFSKQAAPHVVSVIRGGGAAEVKKMMNMFNELFEDGTVELQGMIAVSIFGALENDQTLIAAIEPYMSDLLKTSVLHVNACLAGFGGKRLKAKLESPPAYRPKKPMLKR